MDIRKVIHVGSSVGLTLPKAMLIARAISVGDELEVSNTSSGILIKPRKVKSEETRREKISKLTMNFVERYREDLEALADK